MTLTAVLSTLLGFALMMAIMAHSQKYFARQQRHLGEVNGHIEEMYSGHTVVKAYNAEKKSQETFDELNEKLDAASQAEEDATAAENEMIKSLRTELDRTKEAYEALLEAKSCDTREGNVTFSRAMQTLERLKDYLGQAALEEYKALGGE